MCISDPVVTVTLSLVITSFPPKYQIISGSGMATNRHSSSTSSPSATHLAFGFLENVGGMPSRMSARDDSLDMLFLDIPVISEPWSDNGASTISSAVLDAKPAAFLATHVNVPASSGKTSRMIRVATLSSS